MELRDLFAHKSFISLQQNATHWNISHFGQNGSPVDMWDKDLDRLLETFGRFVESMDAATEAATEHVCDFTRAWQDGTLVCECGAWK